MGGKYTIKRTKYVWVLAYVVLLIFFGEEDYIYTSGMNPFTSSYGFWAQIGIDIYRYMIGFAGSGQCLIVLKAIFNRLEKGYLCNIFCLLGRKSMQIYIMQKVLLEAGGGLLYKNFVIKLGYNPLTDNVILYDLVYTVAIAAVFAGVIYCLTKLIEQNKMAAFILFGVKKKN